MNHIEDPAEYPEIEFRSHYDHNFDRIGFVKLRPFPVSARGRRFAWGVYNGKFKYALQEGRHSENKDFIVMGRGTEEMLL